MDAVTQQRIECGRTRDRSEAAGREQAKGVLGEHRHDGRPPVLDQLARMTDIGRREHVDAIAGLDALAHAAGGAELGADRQVIGGRETLGDLGHRFAQGTGAKSTSPLSSAARAWPCRPRSRTAPRPSRARTRRENRCEIMTIV